MIIGLTLQPLFLNMFISELYLGVFFIMVVYGYLSWWYVNSMNWMVCVWDRKIGVWFLLGAPSMHNMYGLNLDMHLHGDGAYGVH